ncbi:efflux RND transporter permease subunit [Pararhodospirillum photometricum]|uniref:Acriflavin resistance protein n=1 Tax=Pararhodospirillum photometricum DSM 122 TaxID=1150469 RepID=H6SQ16_PARPM|nr:efflux RND transporter permease subunit [Pararhodospirillum photometricum]CCG07286.1 Acriflavin resistance protein [Pararhodospirillum photometricum DSM 122]
MDFSTFFLRRPVFATVVCLLIVLLGVAAMGRLPLRELPDVDAAIVTVTTEYTGAAPEIVDTDVTEVVESAVAGVSGVRTLTSQSRRGLGRTVIEFEPGVDIDAAVNDVRDVVARVRGDLPEDADEPRIAKSDTDSDPVMRLSLTSASLSPLQLNDIADRFIVDRLSTLEGVAEVDLYGERRQAMRIWLDRRALAARALTVQDVESALRRNNVELPAGDLESASRLFTVRTETLLRSPEQFAAIVIRVVEGYPVRLRDVAQVELGVESDDTAVRSAGKAAIGLGILRQSTANTVAISERVRAEVERIGAILPEGTSLTVNSDEAIFINRSIHEVVLTLVIAVVIVVLVNFAFLGSVRATLVPSVTIPVALIGSFAGIWLLGFSINILTLLALILAIGIVVDDAIVVLENIQRRIEHGESPLAAAALGTRQVTFAVIATTLTLIAVFVPLSFSGGAVGRLFTEFGVVMACSVALSMVVALVFCPPLAAGVLSDASHEGRLARAVNRVLSGLTAGYRRALTVALNMPLVVLVVGALCAGSSWALYEALPRELTPAEDRGVFFVALTAPQGSNTAYTDAQVARIETAVAPLMESGVAESVMAIIGAGRRPNRGTVVVRLKDWSEREQSAMAVTQQIRRDLGQMTGALATPQLPAGLGLRGSRTPLQVVVGGPDFEQVKCWADALLRRAQENPRLINPELDYEPNQPQISVSIDRDRADDLGIGVETVGQTLQTMMASREVTRFVDRGREYEVIVQARAEDRSTPADLSHTFVRVGRGEALVPLDALVSLTETTSAPELNRYGRMPAITLSAALVPGYDIGSAINDLRAAALEVLPPEATLSYAGQSKEFLETSGGVMTTFLMALLIVYLVLAAQFESFIHPFIILLSVPLAVSGALFSLWVSDNSLNVYSQIGIILLIGLMAKNGILIVEFANQLRDEGLSVREAILEGAALRLRPILMTVVCTVLGAVPLAVSSGAGAESREAIGVVIIGGLGIASLLTLFLTPVLYDRLARFTRSAGAAGEALEAALAEAAQK